MKRAGIVILVFGLLITLVTGFDFVTREKVVDIGKLEIYGDKKHGLAWSPMIGFAVMVVGGVIFLFGYKKP
jgi:RecB family endonuclease NucS